ncbi:guanosine monophosphate reductase [Latilactobacillus graminis DSM 20719]|uniref:GMP reductase n=1 Tax=Latilactobacillus graminis DSM 20719 TaxID=1423752 RepID=A0AA89HZK8_9LACO|nr:guanosine monophosphate reductase [Latilactobacillus graminis DSM 20719]
MDVFDYEDVQLIPNKCIVKSRSEITTAIQFGPETFKLPVVPANMQTIIDEPLAIWLAENHYFYVMHRFQPEKRAAFIKMMHQRGLFASISVGVKDTEFDFITQLTQAALTPEYITIDIAHGHSQVVIDMIHHIKKCCHNPLSSRVMLVLPRQSVI